MLIPLEVEAERAGGRLPAEDVDADPARGAGARAGRRAARAPSTAARAGPHVEWFLVEEQFGRSTNALSWHMPTAYNVLAHGSPGADRALPAARRCAASCTTPTRSPRSTPAPTRRASARPPTRTDGGWRIDGEKWFVTYGDVAAVYIVMANALVDGELPTLFLVDRDAPGIEVVDDPPFTHNYPHGHPTLRFDGVEVGDDAVIGGVGGGDDLQRAWFVEERLGIAARCGGAMWRLLEETTAWAIGREQGGARLIDHQGVSFPLADSRRRRRGRAAARRSRSRGWSTRAPTRSSCTRRRRWRSCSAARPRTAAPTAACRSFGGRGYMRTNVAERFWRELRVDRIWEGTSEIQRLIVARVARAPRRGAGAALAMDARAAAAPALDRGRRRDRARRRPTAARRC